MALNVTEANAASLLIRYLLQHRDGRGLYVEPGAASEAAQYLASRAHDRLAAGLTDQDVRRLWPTSHALAPVRERQRQGRQDDGDQGTLAEVRRILAQSPIGPTEAEAKLTLHRIRQAVPEEAGAAPVQATARVGDSITFDGVAYQVTAVVDSEALAETAVFLERDPDRAAFGPLIVQRRV